MECAHMLRPQAEMIVNLSTTCSTTPLFVLRGHRDAVLCTAFAPTPANLIASGDASGTIILWNLHTFLPIARWSPHPGQVLYCRFLSHDRLLTMGRNDGICVWDTSAAAKESSRAPVIPDPTMRPQLVTTQVARMELLNVGFCSCHVVPVGQSDSGSRQTQFLIACPAADSTFLFDVFYLNLSPISTGTYFTTLIRNAGTLTPSPAFSSTPTSSAHSALGMLMSLHWIQRPKDCQMALMAGYETGKVVIWGWPHSQESGIPPRSAPVPMSAIELGDSKSPVTVAVPDVKGKVGLAGTAADAVWMFEVGAVTGKPNIQAQTAHLLDAPPPPPASTASSQLDADEAPPKPIASIAVRIDNKRLAWGRHDGRITLKTRNGQAIGDLVFHKQPVRHVAFSLVATGSVGGGWLLASASDDKTVAIWRVG